MDPLYREHILRHHRHPENYGLADDFDIEAHGDNPSCGDSIVVRLKMDSERIASVSFEHKGCVISRAAASLCSGFIQGKSLADIRGLTHERIIALLGITLTPLRFKCATLFLDTLEKIW